MRLAVDYIHDIAPLDSDGQSLLLMLPGARNTPQQLVEYGFIEAIRRRRLALDVLALNAHVDLYLNQHDISSLLHQTLDWARDCGYRRIWVLGVSLGGTGAMICTTQRSTEIAGIVLLAPFLGTRGLIAEVQSAGGLSLWQPGLITGLDHERALLCAIRAKLDKSGWMPPIYLGCGRDDRFRAASLMLSAHLPAHRTVQVAGGHDWPTWQQLWDRVLDTNPFQ